MEMFWNVTHLVLFFSLDTVYFNSDVVYFKNQGIEEVKDISERVKITFSRHTILLKWYSIIIIINILGNCLVSSLLLEQIHYNIY